MGNPEQPWAQQGVPGQDPNVQYGAVPPTAAAQYSTGPDQYSTGANQFAAGPTQYGQPQPGQPPYWGQQYAGPPKPSPFQNLDRTKVAAGVVVASGLAVLVGTFFSLYSVVVTPADLAIRRNKAPTGDISLGIGFYDVIPIPPPIVAQVIPLLMVLAALSVIPVFRGSGGRIADLSAVFAGAASLLAFVLAVNNPLPSVDLTGELADELQNKVPGQTINQLVDSVVSIGPGAGLIIALVFSILGWAAAGVLVFGRPAQAPWAAGQMPSPQAPPTPNVPPSW